MERQGEETHVTTDEARSASTPHIVRYVLGFSLALVILALSAVWIIGALSNRGTVHSPTSAGMPSDSLSPAPSATPVQNSSQ
ncbi:MAG: hypothetical protein ABIM50_09895 [Novosphingobium sp.]